MKRSIPGLFLIFIMYLLFFPVQLRPEFFLRPAWTVDLAHAAVYEGELPEGTAVLPYDTAGFFGYVSTDGRLLLREERLFGLAMDAERYVSFSSVPGDLVVRGPRDSVAKSIEFGGYPFLLDGRLFLISTNRAGIAELADGGPPRWKREYASVITDLDSRKGVLALGLLDSRVQIVDETGTVTLELNMKGSRINAVYGCALSEDASRVAVIHGIDRQYVSILNIVGGTAEITDYPLKREFRTTRYVRFFGFDRFLVIERDDGLNVLDLYNNAEYEIPATGSFVDAGELHKHNLIWALFSDGEISELIIIDPPERVLMRSALTTGAVAFSQGGQIALGIGGMLCMAEEEIR